jgi:hypothetical protein
MKATVAHLCSRTALTLSVLAILLASSLALAQPLKLVVGQTKVLGIPGRVTNITVEDASVVNVRKLENGVSFEGKETGQATVYIKNDLGQDFELTVYVTSGRDNEPPFTRMNFD